LTCHAATVAAPGKFTANSLRPWIMTAGLGLRTIQAQRQSKARPMKTTYGTKPALPSTGNEHRQGGGLRSMTTDDINRVIVFVLLLLVAAFMTAVGVELIAHNPLL
jgi:hypothetical protein